MKLTVCTLLLLCISPCALGGQRRTPAPSPKPMWIPDATQPVPAANDLVPTTSGPASGVISVTEMQIPPAAAKEIRLAQKNFASGDIRGSADHLEKALQIYPAFSGAHNALGLRYIQLQQYEKALTEFRSASSLDPHAVEPFNNQSAILFFLLRYPEAESAARHALDLDPQHKPTRYLLGRILAAEKQYTPEAIELLRASRSDFLPARLALAEVLLRRGQVDEAVTELRAYLDFPNAPDKDIIACSIARLTNAPNASTCSSK